MMFHTLHHCDRLQLIGKPIEVVQVLAVVGDFTTHEEVMLGQDLVTGQPTVLVYVRSSEQVLHLSIGCTGGVRHKPQSDLSSGKSLVPVLTTVGLGKLVRV